MPPYARSGRQFLMVHVNQAKGLDCPWQRPPGREWRESSTCAKIGRRKSSGSTEARR